MAGDHACGKMMEAFSSEREGYVEIQRAWVKGRVELLNGQSDMQELPGDNDRMRRHLGKAGDRFRRLGVSIAKNLTIWIANGLDVDGCSSCLKEYVNVALTGQRGM